MRLLRPISFTVLGVCLILSPRGRAAGPAPLKEPPPEAATEVWAPIPPVVDVPVNQPPADAVVLFDGTNLNAWEPVRGPALKWKIEAGALVVGPSPQPDDLRTKQAFGDVQLHVEWRTPAQAKGDGQGRGNSGVFFMGLYELQILDSFANPTYVNGQAGSVYKEKAPLVNVSRRPGEWQSFDVVFIAPRFSPSGALLKPARLTALQNGVIIQHDVALSGPTPNGPSFHRATLPEYEAHAAKLPLLLQDHRDPVAFRNIWIRELALPEQ